MPCVRQRWCFVLIISRPLNLYLSAYLYIYYRWFRFIWSTEPIFRPLQHLFTVYTWTVRLELRVINYQIFSEKYVLTISTHNLINVPVIWLCKYCNYIIFLYKYISLNWNFYTEDKLLFAWELFFTALN